MLPVSAKRLPSVIHPLIDIDESEIAAPSDVHLILLTAATGSLVEQKVQKSKPIEKVIS